MTSEFKNDPKKKRYYWLQLKEDFFGQKEIKLLRRIAGGDTYTIIYLKMLLLSLRDEGKLFFEAMGDNFSEEIALDLDESPEDVVITITYLESKGLLEVIEEDEYLLNRVPEMVGSESYSAERMRTHRQRKKDQKKLQSDIPTSQCDNAVQACDEEIELEIDIELENIEDSVGQKPPNKAEPIPYKLILDYLNEKAGKGFKNVESNKKLIRARWNEGYGQEDFKKVIDNMVANWQDEVFSNGVPAKTYLQPSTLFSGSFDKYLNQIPVKKGNSNKPPMVEVPEYAQLLEGMDFSHKIIDENVSEDDFIY